MAVTHGFRQPRTSPPIRAVVYIRMVIQIFAMQMPREILLAGTVAVRVLYFKLAVIVGVLSGLAGCVSPLALDRAVLEYDRTHAQIQSRLLLLNIARARHHNPIHFTAVPNVAATFDFRMNAELAREPFRNGTSGLSLALGASVSENPTVSIVPIQGEAFTKRLLTPMDESKFAFLVHQGIDISLVFRLMARAMLVEEDGVRTIFHNDVRHPREFQRFRRTIMHLTSLDYAGILDVGPINYDRRWTVFDGREASVDLLLQTAEQGYRWTTDGRKTIFRKPVRGRLLIANYDPGTLSNDERRKLDEKARRYPQNFILVDIRRDYPGGEFPIQAWIKLRSFNAVIEFVANSMQSYPEFPVRKDPRTGTVPSNPVKTLEIKESTDQPENAEFVVKYRSAYYWLANDSNSLDRNAHWNQEGFKLLYHLYQMTVMDVTNAPAFPITIAK